MTETLWAPWRMEYILSDKSRGCVFCDALAEGPDKHVDNLILHEETNAFVIMNRFPYTHANIMVVPRRHVSQLWDLSDGERHDLFDLMVQSQLTLDKALNPQGMNLGMNLGTVAGAGIRDHVHVHIVPRWNGDTNFMPVIADTRVMPEHLTETYQILRRFFFELGQAAD